MQYRYEWVTGSHSNPYHPCSCFPVSSVNVASGEDVPDQAVELKRKLKSLSVYKLS